MELKSQLHKGYSAEKAWWQGPELSVVDGHLLFDGKSVETIARTFGTPLYIYSAAAVQQRLAELRAALKATGSAFKMHYAMKANRYRPLLDVIRKEGDVGIDTSSPREVALALELGFAPQEISVTVSMPSNRDLLAFARHGVHVNLDTFSALKRWASTPGAKKNIGLRLDPGVIIGYGANTKTAYGNNKFGFDAGKYLEAAAYAAELGLTVDTVHVHVGWGMQQEAATAFEQTLTTVASLVKQLPTVKIVNVGGGLCWRQAETDQPLSIATWSDLLKKHIAPLNVTIACESGTYVVASCGILVTEITTVEERKGKMWVGLDAGHNMNGYPAHYGIPLEVIPVAQPLAAKNTTYTVAGNINESIDIFSRGVALPELQENEILALYPTGAYGASMASDHCLKGLPQEYLIVKD